MQGVLRIYYPTKPEYRVEDLLFEDYLKQPILQILSGRFVPSSPDHVGLAVLHPRKLVVYELVPQTSQGGRANFYKLELLYEHDLGMDGKHFTAFNMTYGEFGGVRGRDMILVQSMDGKLQIFDQSAIAFTKQLVDCLIPGPILYSSKLDAFITCNYACRTECYKYQVIF